MEHGLDSELDYILKYRTEDDYRTVQGLGVKLHQGYHLGRPLATPLRDHPVPSLRQPMQQEFKLSRYLGPFRRYSELKS